MWQKKHLWLVLGLVILYLITHIFHLTALPVFADEAIYIRWSQLIIDDWSRYLFFPLNDGKTPLFVWLMVPFLKVWQDPLFAGRLVSVLVGLVQAGLMVSLTYQITQKRLSALTAGILASFLPFWFFHQRMALMDGLMATWLSLGVLASLKISHQVMQKEKKRQIIKWQIVLGLSLGLGFWTKLPMVLGIPMLFLTPFLVDKKLSINIKHLWPYFIKIAVSVTFGLLIFLLLKLQPAFSQLFGRGGDFLYSIEDFLAGGWKSTLRQWPNYAGVIWFYLTPLVALIPLAGLTTKRAKVHFWLLMMALSFALPIMLLGKVVYARYLLPMAIPLTLSAAIGIGDFLDRVQRKNQFKLRFLWSLVAVLIVANIIGPVTQNLYYAWFDADHLPLTEADKIQYLYEWSSGHGIRQTTDLISSTAKSNRVAVATEGYFGTLPDGILMYLHNRDVSNIKVEGIGQPVREISQEFMINTASFDQVWLIVNSHRNFLDLEPNQLLTEYCRPDVDVCLEVWRLR